MNKYLSFKSMNPSFIISLDGYSLFECPIHGDDEALVVVTPDNEIYYTDLFEIPRSSEFEEMIKDGNFNNECPVWTGKENI